MSQLIAWAGAAVAGLIALALLGLLQAWLDRRGVNLATAAGAGAGTRGSRRREHVALVIVVLCLVAFCWYKATHEAKPGGACIGEIRQVAIDGKGAVLVCTTSQWKPAQ